MIQKMLLIFGIFSSLLYALMNIFIPMRWEEYNSVSQTVSELSAIGAPTRQVWITLGLIYTLLFIAFGWGVRSMAPSSRPLRGVAGLIIVYGIISLAWPLAPMHLRGAEFSLTDSMHIALGFITILIMLFIMGFGAAVFEKSFRFYSILSIIAFLTSGILTGIEAPRIAENLPTPWIGIWERLSIGIFLVWIVLFAIKLLRTTRQPGLYHELIK